MIKSLIFSAPSGSGKTTIVKHIVNKYPNIKFSVSATTRSQRLNEVDGRDYHFISVDKFKEYIDRDMFLEWEEVYPNQFYGTLWEYVHEIWNEGNIVAFDVDVSGGNHLVNILGDEALSFFIKVPLDVLEKRLYNRGSETTHSLKMRLDKAEHEMRYENHFDEIIINTNLDESLSLVENRIESIINMYIISLK